LADIHPFHGVHYNQSLATDLAKVICPPYDIITPQRQAELYLQHKQNFIRLEFTREHAQDGDTDNRYTRAAATLDKWLEQGVLTADDKPAIYLYDQHFTCYGRQYRRRSIICLVRLEDWSSNVVRPHEGTLAKAKDDRLSLLWTLRADTSPIMSLYEDPTGDIASLLDSRSKSAPALTADMDNGDAHHVWPITDTAIIEKISGALAEQPLYIADGHHRYESALNYQRQRRTSAQFDGEQPFDFVMMTLIEFTDPGLLILPSHRLVRGLSKSKLEGLVDGLDEFFTMKRVPVDTADIDRQIEGLLAPGGDEIKMLLFGPAGTDLIVLTLRDFGRVQSMMPHFHSEHYHRLDVSIINHVIMKELLGISPDTAIDYLDYSNDALATVNGVLSGDYQMAFIVNPVRPEVIKAIADSGDRMPEKSTYFYPKLPSGLVFYSLR